MIDVDETEAGVAASRNALPSAHVMRVLGSRVFRVFGIGI